MASSCPLWLVTAPFVDLDGLDVLPTLLVAGVVPAFDSVGLPWPDEAAELSNELFRMGLLAEAALAPLLNGGFRAGKGGPGY